LKDRLKRYVSCSVVVILVCGFSSSCRCKTVNPLMGTLKPQNNGSLYSNMVIGTLTIIGTLAVDG